MKRHEEYETLHPSAVDVSRSFAPSFLAAVQTALRGDPLLRIIGSTAKVARKVRGREGGVGTEGLSGMITTSPPTQGNGKGSITHKLFHLPESFHNVLLPAGMPSETPGRLLLVYALSYGPSWVNRKTFPQAL